MAWNVGLLALCTIGPYLTNRVNVFKLLLAEIICTQKKTFLYLLRGLGVIKWSFYANIRLIKIEIFSK